MYLLNKADAIKINLDISDYYFWCKEQNTARTEDLLFEGGQSAPRSAHWSVRIVRHQLVLLLNALCANSWTYTEMKSTITVWLSTLLIMFFFSPWNECTGHLLLGHVCYVFRCHSTSTSKALIIYGPWYHLQLSDLVSRGQRMTSSWPALSVWWKY